jgi:hypothetical protein
VSPPEPIRIDRRVAIKWMAAAAASLALLDRHARGETAAAPGDYQPDPDMLKTYHPGDLWPLTFTPAQHRAAVALCNFILPADATSPSAGSLGVADFIDEWISAPFPAQSQDRDQLVSGLAWLDAESQRRFGNDFASLVYSQQASLCDDICFPQKAGPGFLVAAKFFDRFRYLAAGGYYTTPEGMKDIGYVGNVPLTKFDGPPPEVLQRLGLS